MRSILFVYLIVVFSLISLPSIASEDNTFPVIPKGFEALLELGEFDKDNYTESVKAIPGVVYCGVWTKDWNFSKTWTSMSDEEKRNFEALRTTIIETLKKAVISNGGKLEIKTDEKDNSLEKKYGKWTVLHPDNKHLKIWNVSFAAHKAALKGLPFITIYIAHTKIN